MHNVLLILVLMFGVFVQSLAGFGGPLIAMPLGIMLVSITLAKPVMTIVAWITGVVVLITEYRHINWRILLRMVLVMLVGVLAGIWLSSKIQLQFLLILYAVVVIAIGVKRLFFPSKAQTPPAVQAIALALAGIMQGLFVSGGSFLGVYAVSKLPEKQEFRATVNAVWAIINTVMIGTYYLNGTMTRDVLTVSGIAIVPTLAAIWLGGYLTKHIRQETFMKLIYLILIVSGIVLLITNL